jgi:hypothetical protein
MTQWPQKRDERTNNDLQNIHITRTHNCKSCNIIIKEVHVGHQINSVFGDDNDRSVSVIPAFSKNLYKLLLNWS